MGGEPGFGVIRVGAEPPRQLPKSRRMIEMHEMRDLVGGKVIEDERRGHDQPPGKVQRAGGRTRSPSADRIAQADAAGRQTERAGMAGDSLFKVASRLPLQVILNAAVHMFGLTGDAKREGSLGIVSWLDPGDPSAVRMMCDQMIDAAKRRDRTMRERNGCRQPVETRCDPGGVALSEISRIAQRRPLRHRQHRIACGEAHTQSESPRILRPPQRDENCFAGVDQCENRRAATWRRSLAQESKHNAHASAKAI